PNRTTNRNMGSHDVIERLDVKSSSPSAQVSWKIRTRIPYAAPTDSRFSAIAVTGITTERNVARSSTNARPRTNASTQAILAFIGWVQACGPAGSPVTA